MGVCTGEVVVGGDDQVVLGDVMNTAARLEQAAEPGEILVADETWVLVCDAVAGESVDLVVKGKAAPVRAWRLRAVGREVSGHERRFDRPLVGREREVRILQEAFARAVEENRLQLVTIIGEPGIGKSRLLAELEEWLEGRAEAVACRRGRCLAYGDGIGFWPLAEIVKQQLEIAETDSEDQARARLAAAVEGMQDAPWLRARLAPLVGLAGEAGQREEVFTAWQRFFDEVAARTPLVLVIEDLHWADPAMLAFVQHLVEWSTGVPILLACTARPELFDAHPSWAGGLANATTLALRPLNRDDTTRLADALLAELVASADATTALVERCGGNPLYAEEYARLLADRASEAAGDLVMPETVRALIGARIDSLPVERKDASPRRRGRRQGVLGGRARGDRRPRPGEGPRRPARARTQGIDPSLADLNARRRRGVRLLARPRPRGRIQPDPRARARRRPSPHGRVDRRDSRRAHRRPRRAARPPLHRSARTHPRSPDMATRNRSAKPLCATSPPPPNAPSGSTRVTRRRLAQQGLELAAANAPERAAAALPARHSRWFTPGSSKGLVRCSPTRAPRPRRSAMWTRSLKRS